MNEYFPSRTMIHTCSAFLKEIAMGTARDLTAMKVIVTQLRLFWITTQLWTICWPGRETATLANIPWCFWVNSISQVKKPRQLLQEQVQCLQASPLSELGALSPAWQGLHGLMALASTMGFPLHCLSSNAHNQWKSQYKPR